jgi:hypothetical protein
MYYLDDNKITREIPITGSDDNKILKYDSFSRGILQLAKTSLYMPGKALRAPVTSGFQNF